jgi:hypothetical protein
VDSKEGSGSFLKKAWPAAKQKTFAQGGVGAFGATARRSGSFFASRPARLFFKKRSACFVRGLKVVDASIRWHDGRGDAGGALMGSGRRGCRFSPA